jgi:hypothetical protein
MDPQISQISKIRNQNTVFALTLCVYLPVLSHVEACSSVVDALRLCASAFMHFFRDIRALRGPIVQMLNGNATASDRHGAWPIPA